MRRSILRRLLLLLGVSALALSGLGAALAQTGVYDLGWHSIDGGGGLSTNAGYAVHGSAGQPDAGLLSGGMYGLSGGFWGGASASLPAEQHQLYLPLIRR